MMQDSALRQQAQQSPAAQAAWAALNHQMESTAPLVDPHVVFDSYCEKNYGEDCPTDWKASSDSGYCIAGLSYAGSHEPFFPIPKSVEEKQGIETKYEVKWPCLTPGCVQDFSQPCPLGWAVSVSGECRSHTSTQLQFNGFNATEAERRVFSADNHVAWPCRESCIRDYHSYPCPLHWELVLVENKKQCQAPNWYQGGCPGIQYLEGLTVDLLKQFEKRCLVQFPCAACQEFDFDSSPCPSKWTLQGTQCVGESANTTGDCPSELSANSSVEEKVNLMEWCGAQWPCKSENGPDCVQDYGMPCPLGWRIEGRTHNKWSIGGDGTICSAPKSYNGRCPTVVHVTQSATFKRAFAQHCIVNFPCLNDSAPEYWIEENALLSTPAPPPKPPADISGPINLEGRVFGEVFNDS